MRKIWIALILFLTACQSGQVDKGSVPSPKAASISCTAAYRSNPDRQIEREESITFVDQRSEMTIIFADMVFNAAYYAGEADNERNLRVWVSPEDSDDVILTQLYQLEQNSGPINQFVGGHGFTGLNYIYHPESGAEMQYWCSSE